MERNCPKTHFHFNGDDDVFVNTNMVEHLHDLQDNDGSKHHFIGHLIENVGPIRSPAKLKCPSRKEPKKTEAVKVLLFGDSFKELIQKKNKFIIGGDIWPKDDMKPREANIGQDKKKKQKSTRQEARDKTLAKLKDTLSQKRSLQASEELFSSSDDCQTPVRKKRMRIQQFSPQPSSDDTDIGSPPPLQITGTDAQDNAVPSMAEIIGCLRELPETLRLMKECVEKMLMVMVIVKW
uniref:Hexosyltransferase n=2 Tax=Knipowitschia caucasica TaxID=637954 RepID=A0AAV2KRB2_KNICA